MTIRVVAKKWDEGLREMLLAEAARYGIGPDERVLAGFDLEFELAMLEDAGAQ